MKKFLPAVFVCILALLSLNSCGLTTYVVKANYDVCYPDGTKTYEQEVLVTAKSKDYPLVSCYSYGGTNYVSAIATLSKNGYGEKQKDVTPIESSTAPIRLNSYKAEKIKDVLKQYKSKDGMYE